MDNRYHIYRSSELDGVVTYRYKMHGENSFDVLEQARKEVRAMLKEFPDANRGYVIFKGKLPFEYTDVNGTTLFVGHTRLDEIAELKGRLLALVPEKERYLKIVDKLDLESPDRPYYLSRLNAVMDDINWAEAKLKRLEEENGKAET